MSQPRLLVIDGTPQQARAALAEAGASGVAQLFSEIFERLCPAAVPTLLRPGDPSRVALPAGEALADYDGIVWTGGGHSVYDSDPAILSRQIDLMRACFAARVPLFGSAWGLHLATLSAGGEVIRHPQRTDFPFARKIRLTQSGLTHRLFHHKPVVFDAPSAHPDIIESLPDDSQVLAIHGRAALQAAEITYNGGTFHGVQYLPEFDLREIAFYTHRHAAELVSDGTFADSGQAAAFSRRSIECQVMQRRDLRIGLGIDDDIIDDMVRLNEISQWLTHWVFPRADRR